MNGFFKEILSDKITLTGFIISFVLIILTGGVIVVLYSTLPPFIPIFNQMPWGEARIGATNSIFLPLIVAATIFFGNLLLSAFLYKKMPLVSRIVCVTSLLTSVFSFLFTLRTIKIIL